MKKLILQGNFFCQLIQTYVSLKKHLLPLKYCKLYQQIHCKGSALCLPSKAAFLSYREGLEDDTEELPLVNSADGPLLYGRYLPCELRGLQFLE